MRTIKVPAVVVAVVLSLSACAADAPPAGSAESPVLNPNGDWYGLRPFGAAMTRVSSNISFSPFAFNEVSSASSLANVGSGYQQIGAFLTWPVGSVSTRVARWGVQVLTETSDGITAITGNALKASLVGNGAGSAASSQPPGACSATLGGVTVTMFAPDSIDPTTELLRAKWSLTDEGVYTWCKGTVVVSRATGTLQGKTLNAMNTIVSFTLTPTCSSSDSADVCIGKWAAISGNAGVASKLGINGGITVPTVDGQAATDANIRGASPAYPLTADLNLLNDTGQSQMNGFWTRIFGAGKATFESDLVAAGATSCDPMSAFNCP